MVKLFQNKNDTLLRRRKGGPAVSRLQCSSAFGMPVAGFILVVWFWWFLRFVRHTLYMRSYSYLPPRLLSDPQRFAMTETTTTSSYLNQSDSESWNKNEQQLRPPFQVSPLRPLDYEQFTVRINSWKREDGLAKVMLELLTCESVAQVQIIWCTAQGPVPTWLRELEAETSLPRFPDSPIHRVVVEEHEDNSLNARFDLLGREPPTAGILTQDDDVFRPCIALDSAFALWTLDPDRMVGFDPRSHGRQPAQFDNNNKSHSVWYYDSWNLPNKTNVYSFVLTKFAFVHKDYLRSYTEEMPSKIRRHISEVRNCEDVAMAFWVSHLTNRAPPLLADKWATDAVVDVMVNKGLSNAGGKHTNLRHECVNMFSNTLHLKESPGLPLVPWLHGKSDVHKPWIKYLQAGAPGHGNPKHIYSRVVQIMLQQREKITQLKSDRRILQEIQRHKDGLTRYCRAVTQERFSIACHPYKFNKQLRQYRSWFAWFMRR